MLSEISGLFGIADYERQPLHEPWLVFTERLTERGDRRCWIYRHLHLAANLLVPRITPGVPEVLQRPLCPFRAGSELTRERRPNVATGRHADVVSRPRAIEGLRESDDSVPTEGTTGF